MFGLPTPSDRSFSVIVRVNGESSDSLLQCVSALTVQEDLDVGSSANIELQACRNDDGSWPYLDDANLQVWNRVTVLVLFPQQTQTVFDGYLSHVGCRTNEDADNLTLSMRAVDASYHMNQDEKTRIFRSLHYEDIATQIIAEYSFKPIVAPVPQGAEAPAQVAQRGTDHAFLRELARRRGYEFYVLGGNAYFRPAELSGAPQKLIAVNFGEQTNCTGFEVESDGTATTRAEFAYFDAIEGKAASAKAENSGLPDLGTERLEARRGSVNMPQARRVARGLGIASAAAATEYASGMLRRHGWWVTARGWLNGLKYGAVLRSRKLVAVKGVGPLYNGHYYVKKVQHQITMRSYTMQFELVRNALGELGNEDFEGEMPDAMLPVALGAGIDADPIDVLETGPRVLPA